MAGDAVETVFVSYARADGPFVERLVADLAREGVRIWWDRSIQPGTNWADEIGTALKDAAAILYVASAASSSSEWVRREIELTAGGGKLIVPVIIDDGGAANLPPSLQRFQWADFRVSYEDALSALLAALPRRLSQDRPVSAPRTLSQGYVFLSYAEPDEAFVDSDVKPLLTGKGFTFWEYRGEQRSYDQSIARELEDRIENAVALVAILSPSWKDSEWTEREFLYAEAISKPRFLILARKMRPSILTIGRLVFDFTEDIDRAGRLLLAEVAKQGL